MKSLHISFSLFCLLIHFCIYAGTYPTKNISKKDGLISNDIKSVIKAKNDLIWLATENGVSTYNGESIINYTINNGLPNNNCWKILEDKNQVIWIATLGGGIAFYENNTFTTINESDGLTNDKCRSLYIKDNLLYVGAQKGLSVVDIITKKVVKQDFDFKEIQVMDFFEYRNEIYAVSFRNGVFRIADKKLQQVNNFKGLFCSFLDNETLYLGYDGNSSLANSVAKIKITDFIKGSVDFEWFGRSVIWDFAKTRDGIFAAAWGVNFDSGGLFFKPKNKNLLESSLSNVSSKNIICLFLDEATNMLYAGSADQGLYVLDLNKLLVKVSNNSYLFNYQNEKNTICSTDSALFSKSHKLTKADFTEYILKYKETKKNKTSIVSTKDLRAYSLNNVDFENIFEIIECQHFDSYIFVNTSHGLFKIRYTKGLLKFEDYYPISALSFLIVNQETIFFQSPYRPFVKLVQTKNGGLILHRFDLKNTNNPRDAIEILRLGNSYFAFSRFSGVYRYEEDSSFTSLYHNNEFKQKEILKVVQINQTEALLINHESTVFKLKHTSTGTEFKTLTTLNLLRGDIVNTVELNDSLLFVATNAGINIINLNTRNRYFLNEEQGIPVQEIERLNFFENKLKIVTQVGAFELNLNFILKNQNSYKVYLSQAFTQNQKLKFDSNQKIFLNSNQDQLQLILASNGIKYPKKIMYRFMLKGDLNSNWSEWERFSSNTIISIPYVPTGTSSILLQTKDLFAGTEQEFVLTKIDKNKPFYNEIWFIFLVISVVCLFSYRAIKQRYKRLYKRQKEQSLLEKRLEEAKLEALTSQMSPHFIFNSLNAIQSFVLQNDIVKSIEYINDFSFLIRNTLNYSSKKRISLEEEIKYLNLYVKIQNLRFGNAISFNLDIAETIDLYETEIPPYSYNLY